MDHQGIMRDRYEGSVDFLYPDSDSDITQLPVETGSSFPRVTNESFMSIDDIERFLRISRGSLASESNYDVTTQSVIITTFAILIVFGALGNSLVCHVVVRNTRMRTPRTIFIINLAISDLTLCLFTQPFNLYKVLKPDWILGTFMCKLVPMCAGMNVFVSTISITVIALDRFQVIVYPTKDSVKKFGAVISLVSIWLIAFILASPLLIFNVTNVFEPFPGIAFYTVCLENPSMLLERRIYSCASILLQFLLPVVIVCVAHARISNKLTYRLANRDRPITDVSAYHVTRNQREARRKRKRTRLLVSIAVVFACSWLPLNIFNLLADFEFQLTQTFDLHMRGLVFPVCHVFVLCSACVNPLLYGWLNDNFRREFIRILCCPSMSRLCGRCPCQTEHAAAVPVQCARRSVSLDMAEHQRYIYH